MIPLLVLAWLISSIIVALVIGWLLHELGRDHP